MSTRRTLAVVVGAGPAGLMAADVLAREAPGVDSEVLLYDRMPSAGRKLLLAGRSGLNLTHDEPMPSLLARYGDRAANLAESIDALPPTAVRAWSEGLGQPTFVGTSHRVFPVAMRATPLLRAWLRRLDDLGVRFVGGHRWTGWDDAGRLTFEHDGRSVVVKPDVTVLALGGASWPRTGSDGRWVETLRASGADVRDLLPSNAAARVAWSPDFIARHGGSALKNVVVRCGRSPRVRGDLTITSLGLEGTPVYALSTALRQPAAQITVDLRPDTPADALEARLLRRTSDSLSTRLRKAGLDPAAIGLLRECSGELSREASALAKTIKALAVRIRGLAPIERAISSAGGLAFEDLDEHLMMRSRPGTFAAGEMLDWDAPTGGYLLQGALATGSHAAAGALRWLGTISGT